MNTKDRLDHLTQGLVGNNETLYHDSAYFKQMVDIQARLMLKMGDVLADDGREHEQLVRNIEGRIARDGGSLQVTPDLMAELLLGDR